MTSFKPVGRKELSKGSNGFERIEWGVIWGVHFMCSFVEW